MQYRVALGHYLLAPAKDKRDKHLLGKVKFTQLLSVPIASVLDIHTSERHLRYIAVVRERLHHILGPVDHVEASCCRGYECALQQDGHQHDQEDDAEYVVLEGGLPGDGHDREHDGRGSAQTHERNQSQLLRGILRLSGRAYRPQYGAHGKRTGDEGDEKEDGRMEYTMDDDGRGFTAKSLGKACLSMMDIRAGEPLNEDITVCISVE
mgnify:CR=1 FL=1